MLHRAGGKTTNFPDKLAFLRGKATIIRAALAELEEV